MPSEVLSKMMTVTLDMQDTSRTGVLLGKRKPLRDFGSHGCCGMQTEKIWRFVDLNGAKAARADQEFVRYGRRGSRK